MHGRVGDAIGQRRVGDRLFGHHEAAASADGLLENRPLRLGVFSGGSHGPAISTTADKRLNDAYANMLTPFRSRLIRNGRKVKGEIEVRAAWRLLVLMGEGLKMFIGCVPNW